MKPASIAIAVFLGIVTAWRENASAETIWIALFIVFAIGALWPSHPRRADTAAADQEPGKHLDLIRR